MALLLVNSLSVLTDLVEISTEHLNSEAQELQWRLSSGCLPPPRSSWPSPRWTFEGKGWCQSQRFQFSRSGLKCVLFSYFYSYSIYEGLCKLFTDRIVCCKLVWGDNLCRKAKLIYTHLLPRIMRKDKLLWVFKSWSLLLLEHFPQALWIGKRVNNEIILLSCLTNIPK